ncbi:MAG: TetR/AcrR family transcriptional regulator [Ruminococcus sp.]|nr:TetR/AcrR family transcriptional regulator [Ruminococcus sp.]
MGKLEVKKKAKEDSLLMTAYKLFTTKGVTGTSVSDIANSAGIGKGTFYLYFKDKYDLKNRLVAKHSARLFKTATAQLEACGRELDFKEKIIFIIDSCLNQLNENQALLTFISKNLSWGIFKNALTAHSGTDEIDFLSVYNEMLTDAPRKINDPEIMLFMIIELLSSTCYSAILYKEPVSLEELKPHLYRSVEDIIDRHMGDEPQAALKE